MALTSMAITPPTNPMKRFGWSSNCSMAGWVVGIEESIMMHSPLWMSEMFCGHPDNRFLFHDDQPGKRILIKSFNSMKQKARAEKSLAFVSYCSSRYFTVWGMML